jgi:hypothetical protein
MTARHAIACVALLLATPAHSEWTTSATKDAMTDGPAYHAKLTSDSGNLVLSLFCNMPGKKGRLSPSVFLQLPKGIFNWQEFGSSKHAQVQFRFDAARAQSLLGYVVSNGSVWALATKESAFAAELPQHSKLWVDAPVYKGGAVESFALAGYPADFFPKECFAKK